jgi:argininosuccinate lyase
MRVNPRSEGKMGEKLWGGRFQGQQEARFAAFNRSFDFDQRLLAAELTASLAYCKALLRAGVLSREEAQKIEAGLETIRARAESDSDYLHDQEAEDVHSFVEARLVELVGESGKKLHAGRSRNDQVATDLRLWMRESIALLIDRVILTQRALLDFAKANVAIVLPGYTHLQRAQPVLLAHWCLAYFEMLQRDRARLADSRRRGNVLPLGSAALAGTTYQIDREAMALELEFEGVTANSIDGVSDRDFCVEFLAACSLIMVHLSRLAEDVILYTTSEFAFFELHDSVSTGSSIMPQKKNPDSLELVRGKAGRVFGELQGLLVTLKGLPLAYNKDMQEDKEAVFDAFDTTGVCLEIVATVLGNIRVNDEAMRRAASSGYLNATELADYLVRKGLSFREAHETVGKIVLAAISRGVELEEMPLVDLRAFSNLIERDVFAILTLEQTLKTKSQIGGTAPSQVAAALARAEQLILS